MRIVCISDTHGLHEQIKLPEGDILLHAGDVSKLGKPYEIEAFLAWFSQQPFSYKIFIAGNHDFYFEEASSEVIQNMMPENLIYLNDSGIDIEGISIWGSPISPWFYDWAFNRHRGAEIRSHWQQIPPSTDILVTHAPPRNIMDAVYTGESVGCDDLWERVQEINPKYHIFGHIHEGYGIQKIDKTTYINASSLNRHYEVANAPILIDLR